MKKMLKALMSFALAAVLLMGSALAADWPMFLGDRSRSGLSEAEAPRSGEDLALRWEFYSGSTDPSGMSWNDIPGTPIAVGEYIYVYSSGKIRKLDLKTGRELASGEVYVEPVNQFFVYPAYAEGKVFVPCQKANPGAGGENGCYLRVYDAQSLATLYVTENVATGQMQSPVTIHDGYAVTGTYGRNGVYACFTTADEDPSRPDEVKAPLWTVSVEDRTSFSQNGAAFAGEYCYFGQGADLYVVAYKTGAVQKLSLGEGYSIRSTPVWDAELRRLFVSACHPTEGASVFSFELGADGMPKMDTAKEWVSHTEQGGTQSAPVIFKGRLYLGGGGGMMGSAEPFHVIDAVNMTEIYFVPVECKSTPSVCTAYATAENGWQVTVYVVPFHPNEEKNCSELALITDRQGQTSANYQVIPNIGQKQYCSQSVAIASDGSLLWYNDAGRVYCYENREGVFNDTTRHWGREYVSYLARRGILNGMGDGTFAPDGTVTRAQFVQILAKMSGQSLSDGENPYEDVEAGKWYAPAIAWGVRSGVLENAGGRFAPEEPIRRDDMARMLYLYVKNVAKKTLPALEAAVTFTDEALLGPDALEAVTAMQRAGIINGIEEAGGFRFAPADNATRAQAAAMITRFYRAVKGESGT